MERSGIRESHRSHRVPSWIALRFIQATLSGLRFSLSPVLRFFFGGLRPGFQVGAENANPLQNLFALPGKPYTDPGEGCAEG